MRKIKTVVFDVSGVLIDDIHAVWKADAEAYQALGLGTIESIQKFRETFMMPVAEYHRAMGVPDELVPKLEEEYRRAYAKHNKWKGSVLTNTSPRLQVKMIVWNRNPRLNRFW